MAETYVGLTYSTRSNGKRSESFDFEIARISKPVKHQTSIDNR